MPGHTVQHLIASEARRRGLDPAAVLAVASTEGGLRYGAVGDSGSSFGPFQLHVGGALPAGKGAAFANSPEGIRYALDQMVKVGAGGLTGADAISTIVSKFERPANVSGQIAKAQGRYGQFVGAGRATEAFDAGPAGVVARPSPPQQLQAARAQSMNLLALGQAAVSGQLSPAQAGQALLQVGAAFRQLQATEARAAQAEEQAQAYGGTTVESTPPQAADGSEKLNTVLRIAADQIGKPYVWGAESPAEGGFDCSGLIDWAYRQAGIKLPVGRLTTYNARNLGVSVKNQPYRAGDMIITGTGGHMVMYAGDGRVIAAPRRGEVVQYQPLSRFDGKILDVRRVIQ